MAEPVYVAEGSKHVNKLEQVHKDFVLQLLAEGITHKQITERLKAEYGIGLSIDGVQYYSWKEKELILEKRRALATQLDRLPFTSKFIRIMGLEKQIQRIMDDNEMEGKAKERLVLDIAEQIRKEIDGFKGVLSFDVGNPFEAMHLDLQSINKELATLKGASGTKEKKAKPERKTEGGNGG